MKPLAIDLFCGLGGWTEGLLAEGYEVIGFDNTRHEYGEHRYPGQLVIQDVLTLNGSQFKDAALIVASPPCQEFSYMAMPWSRAKDRAAKYRSGELDVADLTRLFDAGVRIGREAGVPTVIENVRGAQPWVGRSRWNYGSFHLWGDVPALMPMTRKREVLKNGVTHRSDGSTNFHGQKVPGFRFDGSGKSFQTASVEGTKVGGIDFSGFGLPGYKAVDFNDTAIKRMEEGFKNDGGSWFNVAHNTTSGHGQNPDGRKGIPHRPSGHWTNPAENGGDDSIKMGGDWIRRVSSKSSKRKMASAMIAKIPTPLARHIGRCFYPQLDEVASHGS